MLLATASLASFTALFGVLAVVVTAAVGLREYALKARAQRAETDIGLAKLFAELLPLANARGPIHVSEAAIQALFAKGEEFYGEELAKRVAFTTPLGAATQAAAIGSLGYLGTSYASLYQPARAAIESLAYVDEYDPTLRAARLSASAALSKPPRTRFFGL